MSTFCPICGGEAGHSYLSCARCFREAVRVSGLRALPCFKLPPPHLLRLREKNRQEIIRNARRMEEARSVGRSDAVMGLSFRNLCKGFGDSSPS